MLGLRLALSRPDSSPGARVRQAVGTLLAGAAVSLGALTALTGMGCARRTHTPVATPVAVRAPVSIDADPAALLPFGALMVANLGARELAGSTLGGDLVALGERLVPFAGQIDFQIKRDLERAYVGLYSFTGADLVAVLSGSFHPDKLEAAAGRGLQTPYGIVVVSTYAGRKLYTVANVGFTMLTEHTALAGTEAAMRRVLDRIQAGTIQREIAPWMSDWVSQPGYSVLVASDVNKQSFGKTIINMMPWIAGMEYVRVRGRFNPDGSFGMSGALTYPDSMKADTATQGLSNITRSFAIMTALKVIGIDPLVRNLTVNSAGNDVQFQTVLDERTLRSLLKLATDTLPGARASTTEQRPQGERGPGGTSI